jgi:hypothetical protein
MAGQRRKNTRVRKQNYPCAFPGNDKRTTLQKHLIVCEATDAHETTSVGIMIPFAFGACSREVRRTGGLSFNMDPLKNVQKVKTQNRGHFSIYKTLISPVSVLGEDVTFPSIVVRDLSPT